MRYRLVPFVGRGTDDAPFQPAGTQAADAAGASWWAVDLRPDPTIRAGWCLLAVDSPAVDRVPDAVDLPDDPDRQLPAQVRQQLAARLRVPLFATTLRDLLPELLVKQGRDDDSRWSPARPGHDGRIVLTLGPELVVEA